MSEEQEGNVMESSWCMLETMKENPSSIKEQLVSTVVTEVIENYDKEIFPCNPNDNSITKEFVQETNFNENNCYENSEDKRTGWFYYVVSSLSNWMKAQHSIAIQQKDSDIKSEMDELWKDWEYVLSKTEEFAQHQTSEDSIKIKEELKHLRSTAKALQFRTFFLSEIAHPFFILLKQTKDTKDLATELDASKTSKIISDVITQMEDEWLCLIYDTFFKDSQYEQKWIYFNENYKEKPYERNVVGSLKELAFSAARGLKDVGINERILVDILWSIWKTLTEAIRAALGTDLTYDQLMIVAGSVAKAQEPLVRLWIETVRKSRVGRSKEGQLVEKWKKEREQNENQKKILIRKNGVDAKFFSEEPQVTLTTESQVDIRNLKSFLEKSLMFPITSRV